MNHEYDREKNKKDRHIAHTSLLTAACYDFIEDCYDVESNNMLYFVNKKNVIFKKNKN